MFHVNKKKLGDSLREERYYTKYRGITFKDVLIKKNILLKI